MNQSSQTHPLQPSSSKPDSHHLLGERKTSGTADRSNGGLGEWKHHLPTWKARNFLERGQMAVSTSRYPVRVKNEVITVFEGELSIPVRRKLELPLVPRENDETLPNVRGGEHFCNDPEDRNLL